MPRASKLTNFPQSFYNVIHEVEKSGLFTVKLPNKELANAMRMRFYAFFYSLTVYDAENYGVRGAKIQIRQRENWLEFSMRDKSSSMHALEDALNRGWSIPLDPDELP